MNNSFEKEKFELFTEKYRPKTFNDLILNGIVKFENKFRYKRISHLLLHSGEGGTGKGSIVNIIEVLGLVDHLERIDCSVNGTKEFLSKKVNTYPNSLMWTLANKRVCLFLDECNRLSPEAFETLKIPIEKWGHQCMFIIATNNIDAIPHPVASRFTIIDLSYPDKQLILERLIFICNKEKIKFQEMNLQNIIEKFYPSIREMINFIQFNQDELNDNEMLEFNYKYNRKIIGDWIWKNYISKGNFASIKNYINKNGIGYSNAIQSINIPARVKKIDSLELNELFVKSIKKIKKNNGESVFDEFLVKLGQIITKK